MKSDKEIVDWLCDHATFIIVVHNDGKEEAIKMAGQDIPVREILIDKIEE